MQRRPSMTELLGFTLLAGYQNRERLAHMLGGDLTPMPRSDAGQKNLDAREILVGGLGELLQQFREAGHGDKAESWVKMGTNLPINEQELEQVLAPEVLGALSSKTGMSQDEILTLLSLELPEVVDRYTPQGRVPTASELHILGLARRV